MSEKNVLEQSEFNEFENFEYTFDTLVYLRSLLDDFTLDCFRLVSKRHAYNGFAKTKIDDYRKHRRKYDYAFVALEHQGFIEIKSISTMKPYFLTRRGFQLVSLLKEEKQQKLREGQ